MATSNGFAVQLLRTGASAYGAHAADLLLEREPSCDEAFGSGSFNAWKDHLEGQVLHLAASLEMDDPSLFAQTLAWTRQAFESREVAPELVRESIESLRTALVADLPDGAAELAVDFIDRSLADLDAQGDARGRLSASDPMGKLALMFIEAALAGKRWDAVQMILDAVEDGLPVTDAYERVLLPAQVEVGTLWHLHQMSIPEEHVVTETTRSAMLALAMKFRGNDDKPKGIVLVGGVEGDRHDVAVRAVADLFDIAGFRSVCLGGDVPVRDIAEAVTCFEPDVLVLSATMVTHLGMLKESVYAARNAARKPMRIFVGGAPFSDSPDLYKKVGADASAGTPSEAIRIASE